nr:helix-turn-helix transcriptional regulator [Streptococcus gallolyticus]
MIFNERLKKRRLEKGFTQQQIADKLNINRVTYTNWEKGNREPNLDKIIELTQILDTTIDYLVGLSDIPTRGITTKELDELSREKVLERIHMDYDILVLYFLQKLAENNNISIDKLLEIGTQEITLSKEELRTDLYRALEVWETKFKFLFSQSNGNNSETNHKK